MYKFLLLFVTALALQTAFARPGQNLQQRQQAAQKLLQLVRSISNEASNSVQNIQVGNQLGKHVLVSEANELAHNIHEVTYHLQQIIRHNQNGKRQQTLQEVANSLNDVVHAVLQAVRHEPNQLQSQLKVQIGNIATEAERLGSTAQQQLESDDVNDAVLVILDDLVVAVQQVHVLNKLQNQNQLQIKNHVQAVVNEVSNVIQSVNSKEVLVSNYLAYLSHHLAYHLDEVTHHLQREIQHQHGEVEKVVRQVVGKLQEVRVSLEQAHHDSSISDLRKQLKTNIHSIGAQIERLVEVVHSNNVNEQEVQNLRDVVHVVLARLLAAARQLQRNVGDLVENNQKN